MAGRFEQIFGAGTKPLIAMAHLGPLPGTPLQSSMLLITGQSTNATSTPANSVVTGQITPSSSANLVDVYAQGLLTNSTTSQTSQIRLVRGSTPIGMGNCQMGCPSNNTGVSLPISWLDFPGSASAVTYTVQLAAGSGGTAGYPGNNGIIGFKELQA